MNHKDLVEIAYKWVLKNASCGVAFKELHTASVNGEQPDVIGFGGWGHSVLIECKATRSDFLSDKKKKFRQNPSDGMGKYRYYCCPNGLIKIEELPEKWGLIYVNEKGRAIRIHKPPLGYDDGHERNMLAEHGFMYSALRRLHYRGVVEQNIYSQINL